MRALTAAVLALVLSSTYLLRALQLAEPADLAAARGYGLILLSAWVLLEVVLLRAAKPKVVTQTVAAPAPPPVAPARDTSRDAERDVVSFLGLLQSRGRFIDFLMDDVTKYSDAQVGAAARVVHQGCASVVTEYLDVKPVRTDAEGTSLTLEKDYDARSVRLLGRVLGEPPFRGKLLHRGWQTGSVRLPRATQEAPAGAGIIAPAEVEVH